MRKLLFSVVVLAGTWAFMGPVAGASVLNPFRHFFEHHEPVKPQVPKAIKPSWALGQKLYVRACESCHGPKGNGEGFWGLPTGDKAPALDHLSPSENTPEFLTRMIAQGKGMMPEWSLVLNRVQIESLVQYLRSLNTQDIH
ncbi:c-type cytochrome [Sulfobacillus thermosulfidooxidans]|uniref:c-type cytochrome n=1 Tax=Sulfobacillus thermosulfidooxidans TaxID=28034 RepID=UPI0006B432CE|nr:cytochrome c [Sulfobacillus thermosulfidooxidans]